jgi:hypothetical protein
VSRNEEVESLVQAVLSEFYNLKDLPNKEYLERLLTNLEAQKEAATATSTNPEVSSRMRAKARDTQMQVTGLINGIKFGISFWLYKDQDLSQ